MNEINNKLLFKYETITQWNLQLVKIGHSFIILENHYWWIKFHSNEKDFKELTKVKLKTSILHIIQYII